MALQIKKRFFSGNIARGAEQGVVELIGDLIFNTYATGGIAGDFSEVHPDIANAKLISFTSGVSADATTYAVWDAANNKALAYLRADDAQVANGVDLSAAAKHVPVRALFRISTDVAEIVDL